MKDMGRIIDEIQSDINARATCGACMGRDNQGISGPCPAHRSAQGSDQECGASRYPLPEPLAIDDLLELADCAKALPDAVESQLTGREAFQLGEGIEVLASELEEERRQRAAEQAAHAQVTRDTTDQIARLCSLVDDLSFELRHRREEVGDLELRITSANDQAELDIARIADLTDRLVADQQATAMATLNATERVRLTMRVEADAQHERDVADLIAAEHAKVAAERRASEAERAVAEFERLRPVQTSTKASALGSVSKLLPQQTDATAAGATCYLAGVTIDELFTLHQQARESGGERAWSWIVNGYYDAKAAAEREQECADDAEQRRLGELRADLEIDA